MSRSKNRRLNERMNEWMDELPPFEVPRASVCLLHVLTHLKMPVIGTLHRNIIHEWNTDKTTWIENIHEPSSKFEK